jgi:hypothetical protein
MHLYVITVSLNNKSCSMGNQFKLRKAGVIGQISLY